MSITNLISLIVLALILTVGITVYLFLKRYLKDIDGAVGITSQSEKENAMAEDRNR